MDSFFTIIFFGYIIKKKKRKYSLALMANI